LNKPLVGALAISQAFVLASCNPPAAPNTIAGGDETNAAIAALDANVINSDAASGSAANTSATSPSAPQSQWTYRTERDEVRDAEIRFATITSSNEINFAPPYDGGSSARMTIRRHPEHGLDIIFSVSPSQMVCDVSDGCRALINIDGHQERITLLMPADYSSDQLFVSNAQSLLARLRGSRRVIIELPFYQEGNRQFTFETAGLEWEGARSRATR
jgi:hypothetical protein